MLPRAGFYPSSTLATVNPYVYHLGLAVVAFGYLPHIDFVKRLTGLSWPALPDWAMYVAAGASIVSLFIALLFRLTDEVLRLISTFDDYFTWIVVMLPLITGERQEGRASGRGARRAREEGHALQDRSTDGRRPRVVR